MREEFSAVTAVHPEQPQRAQPAQCGSERGIGTFENGVEKCRVLVTLATGIPESVCKQINLGYRDPKSIRKEDFENREHEGVLFVPKAGEMLYHLKNPPKWAGGR